MTLPDPPDPPPTEIRGYIDCVGGCQIPDGVYLIEIAPIQEDQEGVARCLLETCGRCFTVHEDGQGE